MNQKGLAPIVIILLIAAAIGGYLVYSGKVNFPQNKTNQQTTETYKEDKTANWKIYTNTKYYYSFQYPQELELGVIGLGGEEDRLETTRSLMLESKTEPPQGLTMFITAGQTSYKTIDEYSNDLGKSKPSSKEPVMIVSKEKTSLAGVEAIKYTHNQQGAGLVLSVVSLKNGYLYQLSLNFSDNNSQNLATFNQILSSFKFLDQNAIDTSNWKIYSSNEFYLKYPNSWFIDPENIKEGEYIKFFLEGTTPNPTKSMHEFGNEVFRVLVYGDESVFNGLRSAVPSPKEIKIDGKSALRSDNQVDILMRNKVLHLEFRKGSKSYIDQILSSLMINQ